MLELRGIAKSFGTSRVVRDVDLAIAEGEFFSLLGPSGCGKTTILRMIAGIFPPDAGRVLLDGVDVTHAPINRRDLTLVFQNYALFPHMTVAENVRFGLAMRGVDRAEAAERVRQALELVQLPGLEGRKPAQLSGGQQQRVALARAIVVRPRLLLLDEPLSNLDASLRDQMRWHLKEIQHRTGITTVLVTHDIQEAFALSDRIAVMNAGGIEQVGTPTAIYGRPANAFVAGFTGDINLLEGIAENDGRGGVAVRLAGGQCIAVPAGAARPGVQRPVKVLVRPEAVEVHAAAATPPGISPDGARTTLAAAVEEATFLGPHVRMALRVGDLRMVAAVPGHLARPDRAVGSVSIARDACVVLH